MLHRKPLFLSVETGEEFVARVKQKHKWWFAYGARNEALDNAVWDAFKMQRKLIERSG